MTPAQIEAAARELCRMRGLDPDERIKVTIADPLGPDVRWKECRFEVERFAQIGTAIAHALQKPNERAPRKARSPRRPAE